MPAEALMRTAPKSTCPEEPSDEALFERFRHNRNHKDFESLIGRHQGVAFRMAVAVCGEAALAAEALQETYVYLARSKTSYENRGPGSFRRWLLGTVVNVARKCKRTEKRIHVRENKMRFDPETSPFALARQADPAAEARRAESLSAVREALSGLTDGLRVPVLLHVVEGLPQDEISRLIGVSQPQVSRRIAQGLELLRRHLAAVGVAFPAAALPGLLRNELDAQMPADLGKRIMDRVHRALAASRRLAPARKAISFHRLGWIAGCILAVAVLTYRWFLPARETLQPAGAEARAPKIEVPESTPPLPPAEVPRTAFSRTWDFNAPGLPKDIQVTEGQWRWIADGGPDGSGCMETTEDPVFVDLGFSGIQKPIEIAIQAQPLLPRLPAEHLCSVAYEHFDRAAMFRNVGAPNRIDPKRRQWVDGRILLTGGYGDNWSNGQRTHFIAYENPGGGIFLILRGKHRLDNLSIREIGADELPDVSEYLSALAKIPPTRRIGTVEVPELKSAIPGRTVSIEFSPQLEE